MNCKKMSWNEKSYFKLLSQLRNSKQSIDELINILKHKHPSWKHSKILKEVDRIFLCMADRILEKYPSPKVFAEYIQNGGQIVDLSWYCINEKTSEFPLYAIIIITIASFIVFLLFVIIFILFMRKRRNRKTFIRSTPTLR